MKLSIHLLIFCLLNIVTSFSQSKSLVWKPEFQVFYNWNQSTNAFDLVDTTFFEYNLENGLAKTSVSSRNDTITHSYTKDWDSNGKLLYTCEQYNANGLGLDTTLYNTYEYDNFGNLLTYKLYSCADTTCIGDLALIEHENYSYQLDVNGRPIEKIRSYLNTTTFTLEESEKIIYTRNVDGRVTAELTYVFENNSWKLRYRTQNFYSNSLVESILIEKVNSTGNFYPFERYTNLTICYTEPDYSDYYFSTYNQDNYDTLTGQYIPFTRKKTLFTPNSETRIQEYYSNGNWDSKYIHEHTTDAYGNVTSVIEYQINNNFIDTIVYSLSSHFLDVDHHPIESIINFPHENQKNKLIFANYIQMEQFDPILESVVQTQNSTSFYPNPSNGIFTVDNDFIQLIKVFHSTGVLLYSTTSNIIDLSNQNAGLYYIQLIETSGAVTYQSVMKL